MYPSCFNDSSLLSSKHSENDIFSLGKLTALDLGNNSLSAKGAFQVAEYIRKSRSLLWLNLYMNDIGDEVLASHFVILV